MSQRNYSELSSYDFECLVRDLMQAEVGVRMEVFPIGRDGGIDVRLLSSKAQSGMAVQCKHSPEKSFKDIKSSLIRESKKAIQAGFDDYWLATSASLTAANKAMIEQIYGPDLLPQSRILGRSDLDNLLNLYPQVEQSNYKLYLTSTAVLQRLFSNESFLRREGLQEEIRERLRLYVQTPAFDRALKLLSGRGVCIISGAPGVGKTTLAEMILLHFLERGYEPIVVSEDISEAERLFRLNAKQIFFYDDFLGQNALANNLGKNEDSRLLSFFRKVGRSNDKLLVLTTREYILAKARQVYERLNDRYIDLRKIMLDLSDYSGFHRAHILYNHIYFSQLSSSARRSVLAHERYVGIANHRNYNPRLISLVIASAIEGSAEVDGPRFAEYALKSLDDPAQLWNHIYERQLPPTARDLLLVLLSLPGSVDLSDVRAALQYYQESLHSRADGHHQVSEALDVLEGVFVRIGEQTDIRVVSFANSSFVDYLLGYLDRNVELVDKLAEGAYFFDQCARIWSWADGFPKIQPTLFDDHRPPIYLHVQRRPAPLIDSMKRTIGSPACNVRYQRYQSVRFAVKDMEQAESRCVLMLEAAKRLAPSDGDLLAAVVETLMEKWGRDGIEDPDRVLAILHDLRRRIPESQFMMLVRMAKASFEENLYEPSDFLNLQEIYRMLGRRDQPEFAWLSESFLEYVEAETEVLLISDDYIAAQTELEELENAADQLGIDIDRFLAPVREAVARLEEVARQEEAWWREEEAWWQEDAGSSREQLGQAVTNVASQEEIHDLFRTLDEPLG